MQGRVEDVWVGALRVSAGGRATTAAINRNKRTKHESKAKQRNEKKNENIIIHSAAIDFGMLQTTWTGSDDNFRFMHLIYSDCPSWCTHTGVSVSSTQLNFSFISAQFWPVDEEMWAVTREIITHVHVRLAFALFSAACLPACLLATKGKKKKVTRRTVGHVAHDDMFELGLYLCAFTSSFFIFPLIFFSFLNPPWSLKL